LWPGQPQAEACGYLPRISSSPDYSRASNVKASETV
jgi:hypothetical protein